MVSVVQGVPVLFLVCCFFVIIVVFDLLTDAWRRGQDIVLLDQDAIAQVVRWIFDHRHPRPLAVAPHRCVVFRVRHDLDCLPVIGVLVLVHNCAVYSTFWLNECKKKHVKFKQTWTFLLYYYHRAFWWSVHKGKFYWKNLWNTNLRLTINLLMFLPNQSVNLRIAKKQIYRIMTIIIGIEHSVNISHPYT